MACGFIAICARVESDPNSFPNSQYGVRSCALQRQIDPVNITSFSDVWEWLGIRELECQQVIISFLRTTTFGNATNRLSSTRPKQTGQWIMMEERCVHREQSLVGGIGMPQKTPKQSSNTTQQ